MDAGARSGMSPRCRGGSVSAGCFGGLAGGRGAVLLFSRSCRRRCCGRYGAGKQQSCQQSCTDPDWRMPVQFLLAFFPALLAAWIGLVDACGALATVVAVGIAAGNAIPCCIFHRLYPSPNCSTKRLATTVAPCGVGCSRSAVTSLGLDPYQRAMVPSPPIAL